MRRKEDALFQCMKIALTHTFRGGWRNDLYYILGETLLVLIILIGQIRPMPWWRWYAIVGLCALVLLSHLLLRPRSSLWAVPDSGWGWAIFPTWLGCMALAWRWGMPACGGVTVLCLLIFLYRMWNTMRKHTT